MNTFELKWQQHIDDIKSDVSLYIHKKTKAEVIVIKNDDPEKTFGISFKTLPKTHNGIAHILEHMVLTGSEKYPVKDPFSYLLKTSLYTFLNAMTYRDKTIYPVASTNEKSFENLVDVYLDTVFFPNLNENTFKQQGWHYSLSDINSEIEYKGVVFNEMKGAFSDPNELIYRYLDRSLFPDSVYGVESGGVPKDIPNLTFEELKNFHASFYHPSNAKVLLYGDLDAQKYMHKLSVYFDAFEINSDIPEIKSQAKFTKEIHVQESYAQSSGTDIEKCYLGIGWVLDITEKDFIPMEVMTYVLLNSPASPFRKAILDSGYCEQIVPFGFNSGYKQPILYVGFSGVLREDLSKLEKLVESSIRDFVKNVNSELLNAGLNKLEFIRSEADFGGEPKGLVYFDLMLSSWLYGRDPREGLYFKKEINDLRETIKVDINLFKDLFTNCLLSNKHKAILQLTPDTVLLDALNKEEKNKLAEIKNNSREGELEELIKSTEEFETWNKSVDTKEQIDKLPKLSISDVDKKIKTFQTKKRIIKPGHTVLLNEVETNDIVYLDIAYDLLNLPKNLISYAQLYGKSMNRLGTKDISPQELGLMIDSELGGFHYESNAHSKINSSDFSAYFIASSKILLSNLTRGLGVFERLLLETNFDNLENLEQLIIEEKAACESSLVSSGHQYANIRARSSLSPVYDIREKVSNIEYLLFLRDLEKKIKNKQTKEISEDLMNVHDLLLSGKKVINITCNASINPKVLESLNPLLEKYSFVENDNKYEFEKTVGRREAFIVSSEVNFVSEAYALGNIMGNEGQILAVAKELNTDYLWQKVRSEGGAYGASAYISINDLIFSVASYRDPNILNTYDSYKKIGDFLAKFQPNTEALESLIIGSSNYLNPHLTPSDMGEMALIMHFTDTTFEIIQSRLEALLALKVEDIQKIGDSFAKVLESEKNMVILGKKSQIEEYNKNNTFTIKTLS